MIRSLKKKKIINNKDYTVPNRNTTSNTRSHFIHSVLTCKSLLIIVTHLFCKEKMTQFLFLFFYIECWLTFPSCLQLKNYFWQDIKKYTKFCVLRKTSEKLLQKKEDEMETYFPHQWTNKAIIDAHLCWIVLQGLWCFVQMHSFKTCATAYSIIQHPINACSSEHGAEEINFKILRLGLWYSLALEK